MTERGELLIVTTRGDGFCSSHPIFALRIRFCPWLLKRSSAEAEKLLLVELLKRVFGIDVAGTNRHGVPTGGASRPRWSPDGKQLFNNGDAVVAVDFRPDGYFSAPRKLFDGSSYFLKYRF